MYISGDIKTQGLGSSPLHLRISWPLLARHKLNVTPLYFPLCTSPAVCHFFIEHSRNLAINGCLVLYCIITIRIFFFFLPEFLIWLDNLRHLCFVHLCFHQQPLAYSSVPNEPLFSQWPFYTYLHLLVQGAEAKGGNPGTQEEIEINICTTNM